MKPEQNVVQILFEKYQKYGYVTEDDIFELCEEYNLSFIKTDYVGNQLLSKGVLITKKPVNVPVKFEEQEDEQELYDYSQSNYDEIYQYFLTNYPEMKPVIQYVKSIPPVQRNGINRLFEQSRSGNRFARKTIIEKYIRLALKSTVFYKDKTTIPLNDIFSVAMLGVIKAVDNYNPYENSYFSSYIALVIKQTVERYICNFERTIRIPVHVIDKIFFARKILADFPDLERDEQIELIAKDSGIPFNEAEELHDMAKLEYHISLEEMIEDEKSENPVYELIDSGYSVEEIAERNVLEENIAKVLEKLPEKEQQVLAFRYGLKDEEILTLEEIGQMFGVSRERVRQIESKALRKLRHPSKREYIKTFY